MEKVLHLYRFAYLYGITGQGQMQYVCGWIARAALLKTAHWAVFAPSSATAPQLFESTRAMSLALLQNKNLSALAYVEAFWWARVDSNHRS